MQFPLEQAVLQNFTVACNVISLSFPFSRDWIFHNYTSMPLHLSHFSLLYVPWRLPFPLAYHINLFFSSYNRNPLFTIKTNSYHFCKLSLVKLPSAHGKQNQDSEFSNEEEIIGAGSTEISDERGGQVQGSLTEYLHPLEGLLVCLGHLPDQKLPV